MATTPEQKIKRKVSEMFKKYKVFYFMPGNNGFGKSGIPDYVACVCGTFVGVECKADKTKKPTALQLARKAEIQKAGGMWLLVYDDETLMFLETTLKMLIGDADASFQKG